MDDLSLHILDVAENSLAAGATSLTVDVIEDSLGDKLSLEIVDNGRGMDEATLARVTDPFCTTRTTRSVGLGLSLLDAAARAANGSLDVHSVPGSGTRVCVTFQRSHIDCKPLGQLADTITALIAGAPALDLAYRHEKDGRSVRFTTGEARARLGGLPINSPEALQFIRAYVKQEEDALTATA